MSTPFIGEIRMGGWNFAPDGWAQCNGALMSIAQNTALFSLLGTTYGGDGQNTFGLPDLRGRIPVHTGSGFPIGQLSGAETVTLTSNEFPVHPHAFMGSTNNGTQGAPPGNVPATFPGGRAYIAGTPATALASGSIQATTGGGQPHDNMQPYLCVMFIIALSGIFPTQN